ncbi:hypothetical protein AVEN_20942-1 [Araneus ventricosus]|uniref:Uncharacterized protein n=1 Tax=Araneus ventricosus TaxID=182803 RepID=A0A4Y2KQP6_ARAVE|nr:hypothetical protein AVEN_20942-1 [Araneus ventricosus]
MESLQQSASARETQNSSHLRHYFGKRHKRPSALPSSPTGLSSLKALQKLKPNNNLVRGHPSLMDGSAIPSLDLIKHECAGGADGSTEEVRVSLDLSDGGGSATMA